jgi:hypothetical protein
MSHGAADNRADDTEHDCPRDREVRVHEGLGDTTHEEADKNIPNEMKHRFLLLTPDSAKITRSNIKLRRQKLSKITAAGGFLLPMLAIEMVGDSAPRCPDLRRGVPPRRQAHGQEKASSNARNLLF